MELCESAVHMNYMSKLQIVTVAMTFPVRNRLNKCFCSNPCRLATRPPITVCAGGSGPVAVECCVKHSPSLNLKAPNILSVPTCPQSIPVAFREIMKVMLGVCVCLVCVC